MSLTSYRAAPPRDKPCRLLSGSGVRERASDSRADRSLDLPEKAIPSGHARGVRALCINQELVWEGFWPVFFRFCDGLSVQKKGQNACSCQKFRKRRRLGNKLAAGNLTALKMGATPWISP